jgi:IMP dehydrogenase
LMGIVTSRDFRYADNLADPVSTIMTPREKLITVDEGTDQAEVKKLMYNNRIEKILVIDSVGALAGLVTMKDIKKSAEYPFATKDSRGQLRVGAALGTGTDTLDRAKALAAAGVDLFVVDSAHGHSQNVINIIKLIKIEFPSIDVMGGNVATPEGAMALRDAGADAIKIGMGPGSICTTRIISGMGVPQITAILSIKERFQSNQVPLIADGGIRFSGDVAKALAAGADAVMLGGIFAGTEEAPGEVELYQGRSFKTYRGMGSLGAMSERNDVNRYSQDGIEKEKMVPEGVEGRVAYKGWVVNVINQITGGIRQSMGYVGCKTIMEMQTDTQFIEITNAGMSESHVHDVMVTKESPNYQRS